MHTVEYTEKRGKGLTKISTSRKQQPLTETNGERKSSSQQAKGLKMRHTTRFVTKACCSNLSFYVSVLGHKICTFFLQKETHFRERWTITCSIKILAWSPQPRHVTWLATSLTSQPIIRWRSLDSAALLLRLMEVLSSLRNAVGNPLPRGHGNENGDTCWMALSATEKKQKEQSFSLLIYRVLVYFSY